MIVLGTDLGPPCGACFERMWVYSYEPSDALPRQVGVRCASCSVERGELECSIPSPTVQDLRALHQARVDDIRYEVQRLIHGKQLDD